MCANISSEYSHPIAFFDGECVMCNGVARLIERGDSSGTFQLASLQGETAEKLLPATIRSELATLVLRETDGTLHLRSEALLRIASRLGGAWRLLSILLFVPRSIRDFIYSLVAARRYALFGKQICRLPDTASSIGGNPRYLP